MVRSTVVAPEFQPKPDGCLRLERCFGAAPTVLVPFAKALHRNLAAAPVVRVRSAGR